MTEARALARPPPKDGAPNHRYLSVTVAHQLLGLPVSAVRDVFKPEAITPVPLAAPAVAGMLNLRGRVHTVVDLRRRLGLTPASQGSGLAVGLELHGEAFAVLVDTVGDVVALTAATFAPNPPHLAARWATLLVGVHMLEGGLIVVLNVEELVRPRTGPLAGRSNPASPMRQGA